MSNNADQLSPASRNLIAGMLIGGGASVASQWRDYKDGNKSMDELVSRSVADAAKAGIVSGAATAVAQKMAGRPVLSAISVLATGAAGLYLLDQLKGNQQNEEA